MATASDCIFCRIIAAQIPALIVHQSESTFAFLDVGPLAEGHTLVIPRQHCERLEDLPSDELGRLALDLPRIARAVIDATGAGGYNLLQNNGRAAGQVVKHVHFHIIPRREGDGLGYHWNAGSYPTGRGEEVAALIRTSLGD